ncbi:MAG: hypothetical protein GOVbin5663_7 [Prokaryotic dsDNA virus sp.]|nr:MAG: hypothetical protein GOVbin5663_7 [Prokaryotic dsDNA virus sp.]|tara:strand:- start:21246 stop:22994 length:1749 start_codon:yes stop_codon:yes gene_type:complete
MANDKRIRILVTSDTRNAVKNLDKLERQSDETKHSASELSSTFRNLFGAAVLGAGVRSVVQTASTFESLRTRLVALKGSTEEGAKAFNAFTKIAATTPFQVQNVVEAGATLEAFGVSSEESLKSIADLAAFMGTDIVDASAAFGRAFAGGAGAADILRERGILQLIKDSEGIEDLSKLTLPEFREALERAMTDPDGKIAGATDLLAQTFSGKVSNMQDSIDQLQNAIGSRMLEGLGDFALSVKDSATQLASFVENMTDEQVSDMEEFLKTLALMTGGYFAFNAAVVASNVGLGVFLRRIAVFGAAFEVANTVIRNFSLVQEKVVGARLALAEFDLAAEKLAPNLVLGTEETIQARIDQFKEQLVEIKKTSQGTEFRKGIFTELLLGADDEGKSTEEILDDMKKFAEGVVDVTGTVVAGNNAVSESNEKVANSNKKSLESSIQNISAQGKLSKEQTINTIKNKTMEASASHIANIFKSVPFPLDVILAAGAQATISGIFSTVTDSFATGGSFVTNKKTTLPIGNGIVVGDNASGMERVDITPLPSPVQADQGNITINITAPLVDETVVDHIIPAIQRAQRLGL